MSKKVELNVGNKTIIVETGKIAKQADGACTVQLGGTVVLVTAVASRKAVEGKDFFPLMVEYQERTYAAGKIPGGFFKREGKPSEKEILTSRLIDRPIRPLFPDGMLNEVQVVAIVLSSDGQNDSDVLAMVGASTALTLSDIPFNGPIASVRVGRINGQFILNPTFQDLETSDIDLVVAGTAEKILMIESGSNELDEATVLGAMKFAQSHFKAIIDMQLDIAKSAGKPKRQDIKLVKVPEGLLEKLKAECSARIKEIILLGTKDKREEEFEIMSNEMVEKFAPEGAEYTGSDVKMALRKIEKDIVRDYTLLQNKRVDNRACTEIRPIECCIGLLPRTHGSGLFTRGQTQSLSVTTLGTTSDEQRIDALEGETHKSFMLHYNFPPFSVGEVKPMRGTGRREIGHGALAERALKPVMPSKDKFPYTVRLVSDILESNGSSSMATVCAGTLALMDAGVPIKAPVAGIAMGLVTSGDKYVILTDIAGVEDHYGDMDFKVAGTRAGITSVQLDMKIDGMNMEAVEKTLNQAREARLTILGIMEKVIAAPKDHVSEFAPKVVILMINTDKIKDVIGPGGRIIKKIIQDTGASIDIDDTGRVAISATDADSLNAAVETVRNITEDVEVGKIYKGKITRALNFGAFCEIPGGKEGLIHVSELANKFVKNVLDEVSIGQEVLVKVIEIDEQGRINLSRKQAVEEKK